jgi:predicted hydrocarbon binding protein
MGAAINGVVNALTADNIVFKDFPRSNELKKVEDSKYYPLDLYLALVDYLEEKFSPTVLFMLGESVGRAVIDTSFPPDLKSVVEALDLLQKAHEQFCKPVEGEFRVIEDREGVVKLRYTAPYNCILQEGLLSEIARNYGGRFPSVSHVECRRDGKEACIYEMKYH